MENIGAKPIISQIHLKNQPNPPFIHLSETGGSFQFYSDHKPLFLEKAIVSWMIIDIEMYTQVHSTCQTHAIRL